MIRLFGMELTKEEFLQYAGAMGQIAGTRCFTYSNGRAAGVKAIDVRTGSGFSFTVLPDRGMDIANAEYCGKPLAWICKNGIVSSNYFENGGIGFLRSFTGGLVTTCGLTQAGAAGVDGDEVLGIHGRIAHIPAERFSIDEYWEGDEYIIKIKGQVRETCLYAENLVLKREISCKMGESKLLVKDIIENEGFNQSPFMLMYHINFGFPVVSEETRLYTSAQKVEPWNEDAKKGDGKFSTFEKPIPAYNWQGFYHSMPKEREKVYAGLINEGIHFGGYVAYSPKQMPDFHQWKMMGQQDYVVGLEPGINVPEGRLEARKNGRLATLKPGEKYETSFEIGVLNGKEDIAEFKAKL